MPRATLSDHLILVIGCLVMVSPLALLLAQGLSWNAVSNFTSQSQAGAGILREMFTTSLVLALGVAVLKTLVSALAAFALTAFRVPGTNVILPLILLPLFLPIEARILPTFLVADAMGLLNTYTGLILPVVATGLGTLILRARLLQIPSELLEAARLDGAGPFRVLVDILLPLSLPAMAALFAFFFVLGWNQYLWPLIASPSLPERMTLVSGIARTRIGSPNSLVLTALAMLPPLVVFGIAQRWIVRGLAPLNP